MKTFNPSEEDLEYARAYLQRRDIQVDDTTLLAIAHFGYGQIHAAFSKAYSVIVEAEGSPAYIEGCVHVSDISEAGTMVNLRNPKN